MADLLECLIQIKGVADTPRRLADRMSSTPSVAGRIGTKALLVARRMAESETRFAHCLALMLTEEAPRLPVLPPTLEKAVCEGQVTTGEVDWPAAFAAARAQTVAVLDRCSADQLNRVGLEPSRGRMTVADLVAVMLAHDTDCLGAIDGIAPRVTLGVASTQEDRESAAEEE